MRGCRPSEVADSLDGYYEILGVSKDVDGDALKKAYRKRSLKYHPDKKGGDTQAFQCLNRAYVVLRDPKRRKKYDILGLDVEEDDGTPDATARDNAVEGDEAEQLPSTLSKESELAREFVGTIGARLLQILILLQSTQYFYILILAGTVTFSAAAYSAHTKQSTLQTSISTTMAVVLAMSILHWSTPEGWIFWGVETAVLFLLLLEGGSWFIGYPGGRIAQIASFFICAIWAYWFNGRFVPYVVLVALVGLVWVAVFFFFLLAGLLIESTVETKLKLCAPKIRREIMRLRAEVARLQGDTAQKTQGA